MTSSNTATLTEEKISPTLDEKQDVEKHSSDDSTAAPLEKVQSRRSDIDPAADPPDGGRNAWLKVMGCFLIYSNIWQANPPGSILVEQHLIRVIARGFTLTFGAFQTYYQHNFLSSVSPSAISWIGTVQSFLLIIVGVLSGPLFDLGWFRPMLFFGNFLVVFGIFMLSLARNYWQVFLAQGVCMGLGAGLLYVPSLALIGLSFSRKRSLAQGITTSGIAVGESTRSKAHLTVPELTRFSGGVAYIIAFNRISASVGFGWAVRTMGFIAFGICIIAFPALLTGTASLAKARTARKLFDPAAFKDPGFLIFTCCSFSTFLGYIVPYFYVPSFAQDALGISEDFAMDILLMMVAASFFGRLAIGMIAHHLGPMLSWLGCALISGILSFSWIAVSSQNGLIIFSVFWGFCSGGLVTLPAAVFPRLCPDLRRLGTRTGMSWGISSFASLTGSPIAGALLKRHAGRGTRSDFLGPQLWSGCCLLVGAGIISLLWIRTIRRSKSGMFI